MLPPGIKIFIATHPVDMRRSHDGLSALVQTQLKQSVTSGHLFVFFNRDANKIKILYWDRNGFVLWYKRLQTGKFRLPRIQQGNSYLITAAELGFLLEGIDLTHHQRLRPV